MAASCVQAHSRLHSSEQRPMRVGASKSTTRRLIAPLALAALALRALIPAGFMPSPGGLFALELCPDGLPSGMLESKAHHDPDDGMQMPGGGHPGQVEHCVFGGASALALAAHVPALGLLLATHILPAARFTPQRTGSLLLRIPLPRGPPLIA